MLGVIHIYSPVLGVIYIYSLVVSTTCKTYTPTYSPVHMDGRVLTLSLHEYLYTLTPMSLPHLAGVMLDSSEMQCMHLKHGRAMRASFIYYCKHVDKAYFQANTYILVHSAAQPHHKLSHRLRRC